MIFADLPAALRELFASPPGIVHPRESILWKGEFDVGLACDVRHAQKAQWFLREEPAPRGQHYARLLRENP